MRRKQSIECWIRHQPSHTYLLLQCPETDRHPQYWQPITGGVYRRETVLQACVREIAEETGLLLNAAEIQTVFEEYHVIVPEYDLEVCKPIFTAQTDSAAITISDEHLAYCWASPDDVPGWLYWESNRITFAAVCAFYQRHLSSQG